MIAQFTKNITDKFWLNSIYTRNRDSNTYKRLTEKSKSLSYDDPVTGSTSKYLYFNISEWNKRGKHYGGDWLKTQRVNLETLEFDNSFSSEDFDLSDKYSDGWISHLNQVSDDGNEINCVVGLTNKKEVFPNAEYWVSKLYFEEKSIELLRKFCSVFF